MVPLYGAFASRVRRVRLVTGVMLFFASNLAIFIVCGRIGFHEGIALFLWVGVFNVMVIAQLWAFANDLYTQRQGERLFPSVGIRLLPGRMGGAVAAAKTDPFGRTLRADGCRRVPADLHARH